MLNYRFQEDNFEEPVSQYIDTSLFDYLILDYVKHTDVFLSNSKIFMVDDPYILKGETRSEIPEIHELNNILRP